MVYCLGLGFKVGFYSTLIRKGTVGNLLTYLPSCYLYILTLNYNKLLMQFLKICLFLCFASQLAYGQKKKYDYYDGPYISILNDSISLKWIEGGKKMDSLIAQSEATIFDRTGLPKVDLKSLEFDKDTITHFDEVENWVALSDVHGQHDLFIDLLQSQGVIDENEQWTFGEGHVVIIGDIFDRGDKVTESLWFVFGLEKQAAAAGGRVHMLLGNHELMVMHGDLRFLNPKYLYTQGALQTIYPQFFNTSTLLGQWLRSKPVCLSINEAAFVHGGFSKEVLKKTQSLGLINKVFRENLYAGEPGEDALELHDLLYFDDGPLWYRGYASPEGFDIRKANNILKQLGKSSIVVGHTSMPEIVSLHNERVFLIDSSIKFGENGQILVYENGKFMRGLMTGEKQLFEKEDIPMSPFELMQSFGDVDLKIIIDTNVKSLIKNSKDEEWQEAKLMTFHDDVVKQDWKIKVRARGNHRKVVCQLPPLKIDFPKSQFDMPITDKLKVVLPCHKGSDYQQNLYKEFLVYKLYQQLDTNALLVRLVDVELRDMEKSKYDLTGFFVEDPKNHTARTESINIDRGIVTSEGFERSHLINFCLFQYMILNQDWSFPNKHNVEVIKIPGQTKVSVVPYDFDYSGIVDQPYAVPNPNFNISSVRQKLFRCKRLTKEEMIIAQQFYNSKKDALLNVISSADYLDDRNKKNMTSDILSFYKDINDESIWKRRFLDK